MPLNYYKFLENLLGRSTLMINTPNVRFQCKLLMSTIRSWYCKNFFCANISHPITHGTHKKGLLETFNKKVKIRIFRNYQAYCLSHCCYYCPFFRYQRLDYSYLCAFLI